MTSLMTRLTFFESDERSKPSIKRAIEDYA